MLEWESVLGVGRFGLIRNERHVDRALAERVFGVTATSVSSELLVQHPEGWKAPETTLRERRLLVDLDVLFWHDVASDPLRLLTLLARESPVVALWPGAIQGRRATYSTPGRADYYDSPLPDQAVVLRMKSSTFDDEVPYEVERI